MSMVSGARYFFFTKKTGYDIRLSLVCTGICIRDRKCDMCTLSLSLSLSLSHTHTHHTHTHLCLLYISDVPQ